MTAFRHGILPGLTLFFGVTFPLPAEAQRSDVLADFDTDSLQFRRDDTKSVRERRQPLYDPVPYRIDGVEVMPRISAETIYDSNIFVLPDATDDLIVRIQPRLDATKTTGSLTIAGAAEVDHRQYLSTTNQSTTDFALGFSGRYEISRDSTLYAGTRNGRRTENRTDPDAPANLQRPTRYSFASGYFGGSRTFNRLRIAGRVSAEDRDYTDGRDALNTIIDQDFRSRLLLMGEAGAEYGLSPDTSLFVNLALNKRDYRPQPALAPARDSSGYRFTAGASFEIGKLSRGELALGYFKQDFKDPLYSTAKGLAVRGKVEYFATPLLTLSLNANRGAEESSTIGTGAYVATALSAQADYELLRNLIISASAEYERDKFQDIDRKYTSKGFALGADYRLSPRFVLRARYDYRDQDSAGAFPGRTYSRHRLMAGITVQGM